MTTWTDVIHLDRIIIPPERQRQYFDETKIMNLAKDILENGLLQPPVFRHDGRTLIAGERRIRAMKQLHRQGKTFEFGGVPIAPNHIPGIIISMRDELQYEQAELSENLEREDLSWQEEAQARARIHQIRMKQNPSQTISDTTKELKLGTSTLAVDLALAGALDNDAIAKAKTKSEAFKILQLEQQKRKNRELAERFQLDTSSRPETTHIIQQGDAIETMAKLTPEHFHCLITDPPYGIGANTFGNQTLINHEYNDSYEHWTRLMEGFAEQAYRVTRPEAHLYIFCDIRRFEQLTNIFTRSPAFSWKAWSRPLIWYKGNIGTLPRPNHGPRLTYEAILYINKGDKPTTKVGHDVLSIGTSAKPRHAAEKPVALYEELLSRSTEPGDYVLDPFAGSGTILPAANRLNLRASAIELVPENIGICLDRREER